MLIHSWTCPPVVTAAFGAPRRVTRAGSNSEFHQRLRLELGKTRATCWPRCAHPSCLHCLCAGSPGGPSGAEEGGAGGACSKGERETCSLLQGRQPWSFQGRHGDSNRARTRARMHEMNPRIFFMYNLPVGELFCVHALVVIVLFLQEAELRRLQEERAGEEAVSRGPGGTQKDSRPWKLQRSCTEAVFDGACKLHA